MIPDTSLFSNRFQKVIFERSICLFLRFQNVNNNLKGKTNTMSIEKVLQSVHVLLSKSASH